MGKLKAEISYTCMWQRRLKTSSDMEVYERASVASEATMYIKKYDRQLQRSVDV